MNQQVDKPARLIKVYGLFIRLIDYFLAISYLLVEGGTSKHNDNLLIKTNINLYGSYD